MKALTICQPYAYLICLPASDPRHKRVENRTWYTSYRGRLYIHAGKSRDWLNIENGVDVSYGIRESSMPFGAVVAIANLVDCLRLDQIERGYHDKKYPWLREHQHTNGPWCWVLDSVTPIGPWPWKGAQGLFEIDDDALGRAANAELGVTP